MPEGAGSNFNGDTGHDYNILQQQHLEQAAMDFSRR